MQIFSQENNIKIEISVSPAFNYLFFKPVEKIYYIDSTRMSINPFPNSQIVKQVEPFDKLSIKLFELNFGLLFQYKLAEKIWLKSGISFSKYTFNSYHEYYTRDISNPKYRQPTFRKEYRKTVHGFINVPLIMNYKIKNSDKINCYVSFGLTTLFHIGYSFIGEVLRGYIDKDWFSEVKRRFNFTSGFYLEYLLFKNIGLTVEPAISYINAKKIYEDAKMASIVSFELRTGLLIH
ncbi:MAG: outer membrane beta-barrel protein [Bacteroidia bacterium]|nr:outer membrane beta-barrel protein [Bacteroidia bacterium]